MMRLVITLWDSLKLLQGWLIKLPLSGSDYGAMMADLETCCADITTAIVTIAAIAYFVMVGLSVTCCNVHAIANSLPWQLTGTRK